MGQKAMTWSRALAGFILLGILAGMLVGRSAGSAVVHTVALGHRVVWNVVLDAPTGRAFLLAATLPSTILVLPRVRRRCRCLRWARARSGAA
jgi:hypothetical protein